MNVNSLWNGAWWVVVFEFLFRFVLTWLISPGCRIELTLRLRGGLRRAPSLAELKGLRGT